MKKSTLLVLGIFSLLFVSTIMWSRNKNILNNPKVVAFADRLMANHPKIERVHTYIYVHSIIIRIFYKEDQISRDGSMLIGDRVE